VTGCEQPGAHGSIPFPSREAPVVEIVTTLFTVVIGTSALVVGGVALASRFSRRVHVMLWGE
jgi:hypothetical protein